MGLLWKIGGFFNGLLFERNNNEGGSRSATNTTYEPDKVKIAEIESETKIRLANIVVRM
ncbi:hypothetical protein [Clostridium ljungdahlii]|nr:hypothetical protein [Clostridium ljungdahlii]